VNYYNIICYVCMYYYCILYRRYFHRLYIICNEIVRCFRGDFLVSPRAATRHKVPKTIGVAAVCVCVCVCVYIRSGPRRKSNSYTLWMRENFNTWWPVLRVGIIIYIYNKRTYRIHTAAAPWLCGRTYIYIYIVGCGWVGFKCIV